MLGGSQGVRGVAHGGLTRFEERDLTMKGIVRNFGEQGADRDAGTEGPDGLNPTVEKRRSLLSRLILRQADKVALAFRMMAWGEPVSDLDERLRRSEMKKRQLQRRIDELLGRR